MKTFIIYANKAKTDSNFTLKDLGGSGGKMDTVARFVSNCLFISHDMRRDTNVYLVLNGPPKAPVTIHISGETVKRMSPDERSIAIWIQKSLDKEITQEWNRVQEGIKISSKSFQEIIENLSERPMYILHEEGKDISKIKLKKDPVFVLGDHIGIPEQDENFALKFGEKISLGEKSYFASACTSIIHWTMDKKGI